VKGHDKKILKSVYLDNVGEMKTLKCPISNDCAKNRTAVETVGVNDIT